MQRNMLLILLATGVLLAGCMGDEPTPTSPLAPPVEEQSSGTVEKLAPAFTDRELPQFPPPGGFVATITNRYMPLLPGTVRRYEGETDEGLEEIVTEVTSDTKTILGVVATVVHDRGYLDGELIEDTFDWFAQDADGNVWYFGEATTSFENGLPTGTEGSWEAGVDGAEPGIIMLARPREGVTYAQENAPGVAEDMARVVERDERVRVQYGRFEDVLVTKEWTPLEPGVSEYKFYARGVGLILEAERRNGRGQRIELVSVNGNTAAQAANDAPDDDDGEDDDLSTGSTR